MSFQTPQSPSANPSPRRARRGRRHSLTRSQLFWIQARDEKLDLSYTGNALTRAFNQRFGTRLFVAELMEAIKPCADEEVRDLLDQIIERAAERSRRAEAAMDEGLGVGADESGLEIEVEIDGGSGVEVEIEIAMGSPPGIKGDSDSTATPAHDRVLKRERPNDSTERNAMPAGDCVLRQERPHDSRKTNAAPTTDRVRHQKRIFGSAESSATSANSPIRHQERRHDSASSSVPPAYGDIPGTLTIQQAAWLAAISSSLGAPGSLPLSALTPEFNRRYGMAWEELDLLRVALPHVGVAAGELIMLYMMGLPRDPPSETLASPRRVTRRSQRSSHTSGRALPQIHTSSPFSSTSSSAPSSTPVDSRTASTETLRPAQPSPRHHLLTMRPSFMFDQHSYITYEQLWWLRDTCDSVNLTHSEANSVLNRFRLRFGEEYGSGELMMRLVNTVRRDVSFWEGVVPTPDFDSLVREVDSVVLGSEDEQAMDEGLRNLVRSCFQEVEPAGPENMF